MKKLTRFSVVYVVTEGPKTAGLKKMLEEDEKKNERATDQEMEESQTGFYLMMRPNRQERMDDRRRARLHVAELVSDHLLSLAGLLMLVCCRACFLLTFVLWTFACVRFIVFAGYVDCSLSTISLVLLSLGMEGIVFTAVVLKGITFCNGSETLTTVKYSQC